MASGWRLHRECKRPEFHRAVRRVREELRLAPAALARLAGVGRYDVTRLEQERVDLPDDKRRRVVEALARQVAAKDGAEAAVATRRDLLRLGGFGASRVVFAPTADKPGSAAGTETTDGWRHWLQLGHARARLDPEKAREAYQIAASRAAAVAARGAQALAMAHQAEMLCDLGRPERALEVSVGGLAVLAIPDGLRPTDHPLVPGPAARRFAEQLAKVLADTESPLAYAQLAKAIGRSKLDQMAYHDAESAFNALRGVASNEILGDPRLLADGHQLLAQLDIEWATGRTTLTEVEWRRVVEKARMQRALDRLAAARESRPPEDRVVLGYDWRIEAKAWHLLQQDDAAAARRAVAEAHDRLHDTTGRVLLRLDEGRRELVAGNEAAAVGAFRETIQEALDIRSPSLLATACALLAETQARRTGGSREALEYAGAAVVVWPPTTYLRDYARVKRVFRELSGPPPGNAAAVRSLLEGNSYPLAVAAATPGYTVERAEDRLRDALRTPPSAQAL